MRFGTVWLCGFAAFTVAAAGADPIERLAGSTRDSYRVDAQGFVTDAGHPKHPGDFHTYEGSLRVFHDPRVEEAVIEFESGAEGSKEVDRYFVRAGRIFQVDDTGAEIAAKPLGDLDPATVAALDPGLVADAMAGRRENLGQEKNGAWSFAWNGELWRVEVDRAKSRIDRLERRVHHDVLGDGTLCVRFDRWKNEAPSVPGRTVVTLRGRELARFEFTTVVRGVKVNCADAKPDDDRNRAVDPDKIRFDEIAPNLFRIDLASLNTRVFVGEFSDFVVVLEGAYSSRACDVIAERVRERFHKPVRYFAFSHLHGQYVGGTRSYIHAGATILVPPSTAPLIEQLAVAPNDLRPDALARDPKPLRVETIEDRRRIEDSANALVIYNVESQHTDEYFIFYFPKQQVLVTGDLLFYRPGQPLKGRSKLLCTTVKNLGINVQRYLATWPLDGFGTKNVVTQEEMTAACAAYAD